MIMVIIDEVFWCFNPTHKLGYRLPTLLGVTLETLGVTLYFLSQGGGGHTLPVGQSEGTGVQLTPASLATFGS